MSAEVSRGIVMISTSGKNTEGVNACVSQSGDEEGELMGRLLFVIVFEIV